ncbi:MAG TPA: sigma-54 dependent transcriptional regulator [bacterium]|nr:sigma-54 dependent transcriptional regulator [bacterium]HOG44819.1 sigma-54 dependent transcriptional regulator [bacterium]
MGRLRSKKENILIIDDSPDTLEMLHRSLEHMGYSVFSCESATEAIEVMKSERFDLVITDYHMPFIGGIDVIRHVRENYKNTEVMMITGYASVEGAVEAIKAGAEEYLSKPFTDEELEQAISRAMEKLSIRALKSELPSKNISRQYGLIGESEPMKRVAESIKKAASNDLPVLITGEPGTGKELVARIIHYESASSGHPFIHVNCKAVPETILDSEINGCKRAEKDGRSESTPGFLETAGRGTVFFDEISATNLSIQVKLLQALAGEITHVGDNSVIKINSRIMASTSRDLIQLIKKGLFREDLFFKLNVSNIVLPPLRERGKDIIIISNAILSDVAKETGKTTVQKLDEKAAKCLLEYSWPGNIRELEQVIRKVASNTDSDVIEISDLPVHMKFDISKERMINRTLSEVEVEHIKAVLEKVEGNKTKAAELLGIDRKTLRDKLKKPDSAMEKK